MAENKIINLSNISNKLTIKFIFEKFESKLFDQTWNLNNIKKI